ncbi:MAG: PAS domain S-box protein, partial [Candidatus Obscuribacterales bacterium]|nr:PAS domain S-box protein [Candidatus Obscuribacterales bacterium]
EPSQLHKSLPAIRKRNVGKLKLWQKGVLLVGVPILFEVLLVGVVSLQLQQIDHYRKIELKQRIIAANASRMLEQYLKLAIIVSVNRSQDNWIAFENCYKNLLATRQTLAALVKNDKLAYEHFRSVEVFNEKTDSFFHKARKILETKGYSSALHETAFVGKEAMIPISAGVARRLQRLIDDAEKREFHPELQARQRSGQATVLLLGLTSNLVVSLVLALYFSKDLSSRLATLADNAERLAQEKELNPELGGKDEIAELDRVFHKTATALASARKKERAVFDNSQDLICAMDSKGNFLSCNPACEKMLGYSREEFLESNIISLSAEPDRESTKKILLSDFAKNPIKTWESRVIRKNKQESYLLWSASKAEQDEEFYVLAHDISSRKELELLKQEFLAVVSHDLRTPLTSISGISKLIMAGAFGAPSAEAMESLKKNHRRGRQVA